VVGSENNTDVFVVGGGPAGLSAAIAARQKGFRVTVADGAQPPIEKSCGEGMMPQTLAALNDLGINFNHGDGHHFRGISFVQDDASVSADFPQGMGVGLRRTLLHERLAKRAAESGVRLLWKTPVSGIDADGVRLPRGTIRARWIVGADGQGSRVRRWSGLDKTTRCTQRYAIRRHYSARPSLTYAEVHWSSHAQAYVTPIGAQEVCVVVMAARREHASFDMALAELPQLEGKLSGAKLCSRERGAVTSMRSLRDVQRNNVALLGDASGGVDAITGEGLRMAFQQAFVLADAMAAGDLTQYQRAHRELARRPALMGDLMLWLGRNPRIRARAIRAMQRTPELFARLLAAHVGEGSSAELLSAGASLGLRLLAV
jgi:menaquinone-9 beta-reductase